MARKKLKPGVHNVRVNGKMRRVRVLKSGQWRFLKGSTSSKKSGSKRNTRTTSTRRSSNPTVTASEARGKARYVKMKGRYYRVRK